MWLIQGFDQAQTTSNLQTQDLNPGWVAWSRTEPPVCQKALVQQGFSHYQET